METIVGVRRFFHGLGLQLATFRKVGSVEASGLGFTLTPKKLPF